MINKASKLLCMAVGDLNSWAELLCSLVPRLPAFRHGEEPGYEVTTVHIRAKITLHTLF